MQFYEHSFSLVQMLCLIGIFQCVYVLVHIVMGSGFSKKLCIPFIYYFVLSICFLSEFSRPYLFSANEALFELYAWIAWFAMIPFSVLFVVQMAQLKTLPSFKYWLCLSSIPLTIFMSYAVAIITAPDVCDTDSFYVCDTYQDWLHVFSTVLGAFSLLLIWFKKDIFAGMLKEKAGKERYWLVISIIVTNIFFLILMISYASLSEYESEFLFARMIIGLLFIYLTTTSLFRIYPYALVFAETKNPTDQDLTDEEKNILKRFEGLLKYEKIYHEASYSRTDLARELKVSEGALSRVINIHYNKSFPQILNEYRINDAKRFLLDTDISIKMIAQEVGFNSLASFNRAFKEIVGQSPSEYRKYTVK